MTIYRGSIPVIQSAEERKAVARESQEKAVRAAVDARLKRERLLLGKTIIAVRHPEDNPTDTLVLAFSDGTCVRIEPSEWLDVSEEG